MKYLKHSLCGILSLIMLLSLCSFPVLAEDSPTTSSSVEVIYYEDGSSLTIELVTETRPITRVLKGVSGHRTVRYRNDAGDVAWTFTTYGDFLYNGSFAIADSASYDYTIENSAWTFVSGDAYCSGDTAIGEGQFRGGGVLNRSVTVPITCSPDGVLS